MRAGPFVSEREFEELHVDRIGLGETDGDAVLGDTVAVAEAGVAFDVDPVDGPHVEECVLVRGALRLSILLAPKPNAENPNSLGHVGHGRLGAICRGSAAARVPRPVVVGTMRPRLHGENRDPRMHFNAGVCEVEVPRDPMSRVEDFAAREKLPTAGVSRCVRLVPAGEIRRRHHKSAAPRVDDGMERLGCVAAANLYGCSDVIGEWHPVIRC